MKRKFTKDQLLKCLKDEIAMRQIVYRRKVLNKTMTEKKANEEIDMMDEIRDIISELQEPEQLTLFS